MIRLCGRSGFGTGIGGTGGRVLARGRFDHEATRAGIAQRNEPGLRNQPLERVVWRECAFHPVGLHPDDRRRGKHDLAPRLGSELLERFGRVTCSEVELPGARLRGRGQGRQTEQKPDDRKKPRARMAQGVVRSENMRRRHDGCWGDQQPR